MRKGDIISINIQWIRQGVVKMLYGEELYRSVQLDDSVQTSSLSVADQLRLIFAKMSNDDAAELEKNEKLSRDKLMKIASLKGFLDNTLQRMQEKGADSATMRLSSEYKPYFPTVFGDEKNYARYYDFEVEQKSLPKGVMHFILVRVSRKPSK